MEGGTVVNIVPERAVCRFNIRALDAEYLKDVISVIDRCAKGAAICAGVDVEIQQNGYLIKDVRNNRELVTAVEKNMDFIGEHHIPRDLTQGDRFHGCGKCDSGTSGCSVLYRCGRRLG